MSAYDAANFLDESMNMPSVKTEAPAARTGQTTQLTNASVATAAVQKLQLIEKELNDTLFEREDAIRDAIRCLVIGEHMLLIGPPGTAKSFLARCIVAHIVKGRYFEWLLNRTTDPSALLGPYKIKEMEKGIFSRNWTGLLPDAHIVFLDEAYKSNEPTLNILLPILNERIFHDNGQRVPVQLRTLFAASNEGPDDDSLLALHDRLLFRHNVSKVKDPSNKVKMMKGEALRRAMGGNYTPKTLITLPELNELTKFVNTIKVPESVYAALNKLDLAMEQEGVKVSDRRLNARVKVAQGEAALNGRDRVVLADLRALTYMLWERPDDIKVVNGLLEKIVDPYETEFKQQLDKIRDIHKRTMGIQAFADRARAAVEAKTHIGKIKEQMAELAKDAHDSGMDAKKIEKGVKEAEKLMNELMAECLGVKNPGTVDNPLGSIADDAEMPF